MSGEKASTMLVLSPLGAAIVEALPDHAKVARIRRAFKRTGKCPTSRTFPTPEDVARFYSDRGKGANRATKKPKGKPPRAMYLDVELPVEHPAGSCRLCGCTEEEACASGCVWYDKPGGICTACVARVMLIIAPRKRLCLKVSKALRAEQNRNILAVAMYHARGDWRRAMIRKAQGWLKEHPCLSRPGGKGDRQ